MSTFTVGNVLLLASMACSSCGQILIKRVINGTNDTQLGFATVRSSLTPSLLLQGNLGIVLIVCGFAFWVAALTKLDLSYAYPIASSSVLLVAFLSGIWLGEQITLEVWLGSALIVVGVALLAPSRVIST